MNITEAQYQDNNGIVSGIIATIDGITMSVPIDPANRHYAEVLKQVADGNLTIADAD